MNKILSMVFCFFCTACLLFAQPPVFDKGDAFVFDPLDYPGKAKDNFEFINKSSQANFGLTLYGYKNKNHSWEVIGSSLLRKSGDSDNVKTTKKAKEYTAFAIKNNRKIPVKYVVTKYRNDFIMTVIDDIQVDISNFPVVDIGSIPGKFKDNVVITDHGSVEDKEVFQFYGSDSPEGEYELVLITEVNHSGDSDKEDFSLTGKKISSYRYYKIAAVSGKNYNFNFSKRKDDLIVDIVNR